jgi:hypothetical protein
MYESIFPDKVQTFHSPLYLHFFISQFRRLNLSKRLLFHLLLRRSRRMSRNPRKLKKMARW